MKQAILIDSTVTKGEALINNPDVFVLTYYTSFSDGSTYEDTVENTRNEAFFDRLRDGEIPQSAQPGPGQHMKTLNQIYDQGYDVVYELLLPPTVTGIYSTALAVREEYRDKMDIHVFNTKAAAGTTEIIVNQVLKAIDEGLTVEEITHLINTLIETNRTFIYVSDPNIFVKGGRGEHVSNLNGGQHKSFPIMYFDEEGAMREFERTRTEKQIYRSFCEQVREMDAKYDGKIAVGIAVSGEPKKEKELTQKIKDTFPHLAIHSRGLGVGISTHTTVGSIAFGIVPKLI